MTTPRTMARILESLRDKIEDAEADCARSEPHMSSEDNNYCAGYDRGYAEALKEFWCSITGDKYVATQTVV